MRSAFTRLLGHEGVEKRELALERRPGKPRGRGDARLRSGQMLLEKRDSHRDSVRSPAGFASPKRISFGTAYTLYVRTLPRGTRW